MPQLSLKETVQKHGLLAKKSLGQNFLLDMNITQKIVRLSLLEQKKQDFSAENVIEIGPGPGGLTRAVLENSPKSLTVVEMDDRCIEIIRELQEEANIPFSIISGDALKQDYKRLVSAPRCLISNLPYNISVPLLTGWLQDAAEYKSMTLMFQKEVADRILAKPGEKAYGRISVLSQLTCKIARLFDINPESFVPAPKIWSTVLLFLPMEVQPRKDELCLVEALTAMAFGQRRKMIRQSLKKVPNLADILQKPEISGEARAENLTPEQYLQIARDLILKGISVL